MQSSEMKKRGTKNIITGILYQLISIGMGIVLPRLFITGYGSETNGLLSSITQIFTYVGLLEAGVGIATVQALYQPISVDDKKKINAVLAAANRFYRRSGLLYGIAVIIIAVFFPLMNYSSLSYRDVSLIVLFQGMGGVLNYLFQGKYKLLLEAEGRKYFLNNVQTIIHLCSNMAKILLILYGVNVVIVQFSYFLIQVGQMLIICIFVKRQYSWIDLKVQPDYHAIQGKKSVFIHSISWLIFNNTDVILLTVITGNLKIVSVYSVYLLVYEAVLNLLESVAHSIEFMLGRAIQNGMKAFNSLYDCYEAVYIMISFCAYSVCLALSQPFISLYTAGVTDIKYVMPGVPAMFAAIKVLTCIRTLGTQASFVCGRFKETQVTALVEAGINLAVSIPCIYLWGIYGALAGTLAGLLYRCCRMNWFVCRKIRFTSIWTLFRRVVINLFPFLTILLVVHYMLPFCGGYKELILSGLVVALIAVILFTAVNFLFDRCFRTLLLKILRQKARRHS